MSRFKVEGSIDRGKEHMIGWGARKETLQEALTYAIGEVSHFGKTLEPGEKLTLTIERKEEGNE